MSDLLSNLRYTVRSLRKNPGFAVVAVLTLTLGLGATTAIYSVVDGVLLRPLPYPEPDRLVRVWNANSRNDEPRESMAYETYRELPDAVDALDAAAGISPRWSFTIRDPGEPQRVLGYWVSASFFELLGIRPTLGRGFLPEEDRPDAPPVVLISHALWQRTFGGDPAVVGRSITLGPLSATVIGVMPRDFRFGEEVDLWAPLALNPIVSRGRRVRWVDVVARLAPEATVEHARTEVAAFMARLADAYPEAHAGLGATVETLYTATVGDVRPALWTLLGGVGFVLLITCANISNLLLTRASARAEELAVRQALGADRRRLVRQLLTESLVLSAVGAIAGTGLAFWLLELFRSIGPADLPRLQEIGLDLRVLGVAATVALAAGLFFGTAPALSATGADLQSSLKEGARSVGGRGAGLRSALVVAQVALALVLLAGSGLLLRSFVRLMDVDPGFRADGVLTLQFALPSGYDTPRAVAFYDQLFANLEAIPGVTAAGGATRLPLGDAVSTRLEIRGRAVADGDQPEVQFRRASGGYFEAMRIPVVRGRTFDARDRPDATPVMIVSRAAAEQFWPGEDPVGRQVRFWFAGITPDTPWLDIVGVTGDVKQFGLDAAAPPVVYIPFSQGPPGNPLVAIRTSGDPAAVAGPARERLRALDPDIVVWNVRTMTARVAESVAGRRFTLLLISAFGLLALVLAGVGIYGVIAHGVRQRTREIGVRMALGAAGRDVTRMIVGHGLRLTLAGLAIGFAATLLLARLIEGLLFGVTPTDPVALASVTLLLTGVALLAAWLPSRRAVRVNPVEALRHE